MSRWKRLLSPGLRQGARGQPSVRVDIGSVWKHVLQGKLNWVRLVKKDCRWKRLLSPGLTPRGLRAARHWVRFGKMCCKERVNWVRLVKKRIQARIAGRR